VDEIHSVTEIKKREMFDGLMKRRCGTSINPPKYADSKDTDDNEFSECEDDDEPKRTVPDVEDAVDANGKLLNQQPVHKKILQSEVSLQLREGMTVGKVTKRALGPDGTVTGTYDENPMLNTITHEVEFPDGQFKEHTANVVAENMLTQVNSDGFSLTMMEAIIDHQKDETVGVPKANKCLTTPSGQKRLQKTTVGWSLLVKWADDSKTWIPLKYLKESHPVETAEFARARDIASEPAFAWWAPHTLRKRDIILSKFNARIRKTTHKHGIEIPTSIENSVEIDRTN
jgi:hypothetical protein